MGYLTENRHGFPGAFTRVTDETPAEASERRAWQLARSAQMDSSFDLQARQIAEGALAEMTKAAQKADMALAKLQSFQVSGPDHNGQVTLPAYEWALLVEDAREFRAAFATAMQPLHMQARGCRTPAAKPMFRPAREPDDFDDGDRA